MVAARVVRHVATLIAALVLQGALAGGAQAQSPIEGVWLTLSKSHITIAPCDAGYCGYISKIVVPPELEEKYKDDIAAIGADFTDYLNKDPSLRNRPIMGLNILTVRPGQAENVYDGEVYNPEDGNVYSGYLEVLGPGRIRLNGCILFNIICRGEDWTRVIDPE